MNRTEFIGQLERLLGNVSPAERKEALQYYNDYFDDAGAENEREVIEALGSPETVAENIRRSLQEQDTGNADGRMSDRALVEYGKARKERQDAPDERQRTLEAGPAEGKKGSGKKEMPVWGILLLILLFVCASPVLLGLALGLFGVFLGVAAAWFAIVISFGAVAAALILVMFVLLAVGAVCIPADALAGAGVVGAGMICGGIGILFLILTVFLSGVATPAVCRGIAGLFRKKAH